MVVEKDYALGWLLHGIKSLHLGKIKLQNSLCLVMPLEFIRKTFGDDVRAIIGNNLIEKFDWQIDTLNRRYLVTDSTVNEKSPR